jgi:hypothetical protein
MITFDSKEEEYFYWWLLELEEYGLIANIERVTTGFKLCDKLEVNVKEKGKDKLVTLLDERVYTPDFKFTILSHNLLFNDIDNIVVNPNKRNTEVIIGQDKQVYVECKPSFDQNNMTRLFKINQKEMYSKLGIFVNLIKIPSIFKHTFTPAKYLLTDKSNKARKINFKVVTVKEYINTII